jgi:hypothetical protein
MGTTEKPVTESTLWYRPRREAGGWRPIATRPKVPDLLAVMQEFDEPGEFLTLPRGDRPDSQLRSASRVHPPGRSPL